ncbi:hypothetical protein Rvan_2166 [Rhodomicrobium vannielii ATCC 17100]|uniref:Uncharacterized protein n=1 Tax=Rhodomicrobium vannielii (strain ATCC 17100 / DSM 162 / LMG 4299 / NCIMB 10020 / ATH 3.1.1) TaxID=648757 RepID=E3I2N2_RHOVT|nr:hypothetical protein [Rhodomicrobium vannielii]ADP71391.1 hypothetical protein Rvan_2166 [Rhodomicrobium vannielii ATCC 17100]
MIARVPTLVLAARPLGRERVTYLSATDSRSSEALSAGYSIAP